MTEGPTWTPITLRRSRRKPRTGGRFSEIAVGDSLLLVRIARWQEIRDGAERTARYEIAYVVTDLWFDPVAGEENPWQGQMTAVAQVRPDGSLGRKTRYSRHALAAVGFQKTDADHVGLAKARHEGAKAGKVVGIGRARALRRRPRLPGL